MNKQDKQDLQLIDYRLDEQDKRVDLLHTEFNTKLGDIHEDIKFIKENLFIMGRNKTKYTIQRIHI